MTISRVLFSDSRIRAWAARPDRGHWANLERSADSMNDECLPQSWLLSNEKSQYWNWAGGMREVAVAWTSFPSYELSHGWIKSCIGIPYQTPGMERWHSKLMSASLRSNVSTWCGGLPRFVEVGICHWLAAVPSVRMRFSYGWNNSKFKVGKRSEVPKGENRKAASRHTRFFRRQVPNVAECIAPPPRIHFLFRASEPCVFKKKKKSWIS
jgi:hypothetical protein